MKTTKILITSLLAAAALSTIPAWAEVTIADGQSSPATAQNVNAGVVTIGAGSTYQWNRNGNGTWVITSLNGTTADTDTSGSLVYLNRQNNGTFTATLLLSGDNDFTGTIKVTNTSSTIDAIANQRGHANAFIVLNSVGAAKNATVCVGDEGSNGATSATHAQERLVVGVDGAKVAGLTGVVPKATVISRGDMIQSSGYYNNDSGAYDSSDTTVRTLELTGAGSYTFAGVIEQNVSLNKTGTGTQIFSGEVNSGVVSLSAGTLVFSGTANIANRLTVTGGTLDLSAGTTTFGGALTLSGGRVAIGRLGDGENAVVAAAGAVTISNSVGVTLTGAAKNGTFAIFSGNTLSNTGTLTLSATNSGFEQTWTTNGNVTYVTISGAANNALVWAGGTDSWTWNTSDVKWKLLGADTAYAFATGDDVKFATAGAQISLNSAVSAGAITIAADTTFSGTADNLLEASGGITILDGASLTVQSQVWKSGKITGGIKLDGADAKLILVGNTALLGNAVSGTGTLVFNQTNTSSSLVINGANLLQGGISVEKTGEGTLSLENSYSYTGGTKLTEGVLQVKNNSALGSGTLTLNGGTLQAGAAHTLANAVNVAADSEVNTQTYTLTLNGTLSGTGTLTKAGSGTLTLTPANFSLASLKVGAGTVAFGGLSLASFGTSTTIEVSNGGNVDFNLSNKDDKTFSGTLVLKNGGKITKKDGSLVLVDVQLGETSTDTVYLLGDWGKNGTKITGALSGAATVYLANAGNMNTAGNLGNTDGERFTISGSDNSYSGTLIVGKQNESTTSATHKTILIVGSETALKNAKVNLALGDKSAMWLGASSVTISGLEGTANSTVALNSDDSSITASTLRVNQTANTTFAGTLAAGIALLKDGTGTLTLSGDNAANTNGVTISGGKLIAAHASALGTGKTTVESGAKLGLVARTAVTVTNGIDLAKGAKIVVDMTGVVAGTEDDIVLTLVSETALNYNGTGLFDTTGMLGSVVVLENLSETLSAWTQSLSYADSTLKLTLTIPEPSVFGLLAGLGALALAGTRRRRRKA